jgi:hypothetical protein
MKATARRARLAFVVLGTVVVLAGTALPAEAAVGSGGGTGIANYNGEGLGTNPPCGKFEDNLPTPNKKALSYTGSWQGTFDALDGTRRVSYVGGLKVTLQNVTPRFFENPLGSFGSTDSTCSGVPGQPIRVNVTINKSGANNGNVQCASLTGDYRRVLTETVTEVSGNCAVTDALTGGPPVDSPTTVRIVGTLNTCTPSGNPTPSSCKSVDTYVST